MCCACTVCSVPGMESVLTLSLCHGFRCETEVSVTVKDVLDSQTKPLLVLFLKSLALVTEITESGIRVLMY